jgi:signal transduction histidine kinase
MNMSSFRMAYKNPREAIKIALNAQKLARQIKYEKGVYSSFVKIGIAYDVIGAYDSAILCYQDALKICTKMNYHKGIGAVNCNIGLVYLNKNDYPKALNYLYKAVKPLEKAKDYTALGNCYNNLGLLFHELDNYKKGLYYFQLGLKELEKVNDQEQMAYLYSNIAMLYSEENKYDSAIIFELNSIKVYEANNDYYNLAKSYNNIGLDYQMIKQYDKALECFFKSLEYSKLCGSNRGIADTYGNIANIYWRMGDDKNASLYIEKSIELIPTVRSKKEVADLYALFGRILRKQNRFEEASRYMQEALKLKDSVFKTESAKLIAKSEIKFGLEQEVSKNKQLEQTNRIQELELLSRNNQIKYKNQLSYVIVIVSVIVLILIFWYFNKRYYYLKYEAATKHKEQQQNQRIHISHELHDNVGAQLAYIVNNLEMMEKDSNTNTRLQALKDMSKQAIVTLRETVWALNNNSISVHDFTDKFKEYALKILSFNSDIKCQFEIDTPNEYILEPLQALNIFRMSQEAFSNAIHHAEAHNIIIKISNNNEYKLSLSVCDDGIGFDEEEAKAKGHYGLINMQYRANEIGAHLSINSKKGEGTTVCLKVLKK